MLFRLIISIIVTVLCFTAYFMLRYMRKHPPNDYYGSQKTTHNT